MSEEDAENNLANLRKSHNELKAKLETLNAENATLRESALSNAVAAAGFNFTDETKDSPLAKQVSLLLKTYEGEPTVSDFKTYAEQFGIVPQKTTTESTEDTNKEPSNLENIQGQINSLNNASHSPLPPSGTEQALKLANEKLAAGQIKGLNGSLALKVNELFPPVS